jgi:hypothetical protein
MEGLIAMFFHQLFDEEKNKRDLNRIGMQRW